MKYYALYDLLLEGFKAGIASNEAETVEIMGAKKIYEWSVEMDEEPAPTDILNAALLEMYRYEVRQVSDKEFQAIINDDKQGLMSCITFDEY